MSGMRVVYASTAVPAGTFSRLFPDKNRAPSQAAQKYHRLMTAGLAANGAEVDAVSAIPATRASAGKTFLRVPDETADGVRFCYVSRCTLPGVKQLLALAGGFFRTLRLTAFRKDAAVVLDILNVSVAMGAAAAAKCTRTPLVGIVTDVPDILSGGTGRAAKAMNRILAMCDGYVLLTAQMGALVNPAGKPALVMEGQVDARMELASPLPKYETRTVLYAGMLHEIYGIVRLAEAFSRTDADAALHIYGGGDGADKLREIASRDPRIRLFGTVDVAEVVAAESRAHLLVNPRPSDAEFTQYSFPSKNMEYMVSGTPLLTTLLPGMPDAYRDYVYAIADESPAGMERALRETLALSDAALVGMGARAKAYVLANKTNVRQAARLLAFLKGFTA